MRATRVSEQRGRRRGPAPPAAAATTAEPATGRPPTVLPLISTLGPVSVNSAGERAGQDETPPRRRGRHLAGFRGRQPTGCSVVDHLGLGFFTPSGLAGPFVGPHDLPGARRLPVPSGTVAPCISPGIRGAGQCHACVRSILVWTRGGRVSTNVKPPSCVFSQVRGCLEGVGDTGFEPVTSSV